MRQLPQTKFARHHRSLGTGPPQASGNPVSSDDAIDAIDARTTFSASSEVLARSERLMEIMQVMGTLVCSFRVAGLDHMHLRVLRNSKGKKLVAVDPVGAREGNWVFTASGSAARHACPDNKVLTDLTIGGIIDFWNPDG